jgi:hypothetical protein
MSGLAGIVSADGGASGIQRARRHANLDESGRGVWQLAEANGFADRIEFLHGDSKQIQLAERANIIVFDVRGALPIFSDALPTIEDARERFLIEGGVQIPRRDTIYAAILETPDYYKRLVSTWKDIVRGVELTAVLPMILNSFYKVQSQSHQLMTMRSAGANWITQSA